MPPGDKGATAPKDAEVPARSPLTSLAPRYDPEQHAAYVRRIIEAIENEPSVYNLAVTGGYGAGKSSVLQRVRDRYGERVVELSLASLAPAEEQKGIEASRNAAAITPTNRIQRELVKQLLYRLPPAKMPRSRFQRVAKAPPAGRFALGWGAGVFALLMATGIAQALMEALVEPWWHQGLAYFGLFLIVVGGAWLVHIYRGRLTVSALKAGPAGVTLSPTATSYFDQYLDEIVYFFEVTGADIVMFEDIDRLGDTHIFETLRALNTLLNQVEYLPAPLPAQRGIRELLRVRIRDRAPSADPRPGPRRIVFIYAIHDGVFEQKPATGEGGAGAASADAIEAVAAAPGSILEPRDVVLAEASATATENHVRDKLGRANRTKFFDLVVPIVPFISASNARDLLKREIKKTGRQVPPALITLVARHVADMRLIVNICNEFEVYCEQLVDVPGAKQMPGLNETRLFALVVYKNTHFADFEAIRLQNSRLDTLYRLGRDLVNEGIADATRAISTARAALESSRTEGARAQELGDRLVKVRELLTQAGRPINGFFLDAAQVPDTEVHAPAFWHRIAGGGALAFAPNRTTGLRTDDLAALLGPTFRADHWKNSDSQKHEAIISRAEDDLRFLRHCTWQQLCEDPGYTVTLTGVADVSRGGRPGDERKAGAKAFHEFAETVLDSHLARDLVRNGHIDGEFGEYVSRFYGEHIRHGATQYIRRQVRTGEPDAAYVLNGEDVDAILAEEGEEVLEDPSMYNVSILDHLLKTRPDAARVVAECLTEWGQVERSFVDTYLVQGSECQRLVGLLAGHWPRVFTYLVSEAPVDPRTRVELVDAALGACSSDLTYDLDADVRQFIDDNYQTLDALGEPGDEDHARAAFTVVENAGSIVAVVDRLNARARREVIARRLYPVTAPNLSTLTSSSDIALDRLLDSDEAVYDHAREHQLAYLDAYRTSRATKATVSAPEHFARIINDCAETGAEGLDQIIREASARCTISSLGDVDSRAWPTLCATRRTVATFANVQTYVTEFGGIDADLAALLEYSGTISCHGVDLADRARLAALVANRSDHLRGFRPRLSLIKSLDPGQISVDNLQPEAGKFVASLIRNGLVADDAAVFTPRLMVDWDVLEAAINASRSFEGLVNVDVLPPHHVPALLMSSVREGIKIKVVGNLNAFLQNADAPTAQAIAQALLNPSWRLELGTIEALRAAGASARTTARLLGAAGDNTSLDDLLGALAGLGDPYAQLVARRGLSPAVPDDPQHLALVERLKHEGFVSKIARDRWKSGWLRISTPGRRRR